MPDVAKGLTRAQQKKCRRKTLAGICTRIIFSL